MAVTVYARIDKEVWGTALPMSWDKVQDMWRHLHALCWTYQLTFDTNVLANSLAPSIRCSLIEWESVPQRGSFVGFDQRRNTILQTTDPKQMEAALFMLINELEQEIKNGQIQI
jgi:hypothetical protein